MGSNKTYVLVKRVPLVTERFEISGINVLQRTFLAINGINFEKQPIYVFDRFITIAEFFSHMEPFFKQTPFRKDCLLVKVRYEINDMSFALSRDSSTIYGSKSQQSLAVKIRNYHFISYYCVISALIYRFDLNSSINPVRHCLLHSVSEFIHSSKEARGIDNGSPTIRTVFSRLYFGSMLS